MSTNTQTELLPQRFRYRMNEYPEQWYFGVAIPSPKFPGYWLLMVPGPEADEMLCIADPESEVIGWLGADDVEWIDKDHGWKDWQTIR